jgi:hypothetical protein
MPALAQKIYFLDLGKRTIFPFLYFIKVNTQWSVVAPRYGYFMASGQIK